jgi:hypothetical protein
MFATVGGTRRDQNALFRADQRFDDAVRLLYSEPVVSGASYIAAQSSLDEHRDRLRRAVLAFRQLRCINASEDAAGFLRDGETDGALVVSCSMLIEAIELFLTGCGDLYLGPKWIWQKLARSGGDRLPVAWLRRLLNHVPEDESEQAAFVRSRLRAVQSLMLAALVRGWDTPQAGTWDSWDDGEQHPHRHHEWLPMRMDDGTFLIHIDERQLKASPDALRLWGQCGGNRSLRAIATEYANGQHDEPAARATETDETVAYLARQLARGLLIDPQAVTPELEMVGSEG